MSTGLIITVLAHALSKSHLAIFYTQEETNNIKYEHMDMIFIHVI